MDDFEILFDALEAKYTSEQAMQRLKPAERAPVKKFFDYFRSVWGPNSPIHPTKGHWCRSDR